jgi:hypothetical protein
MKFIFNTLLSGLAAFSLFSTTASAVVTENGNMYAGFYEILNDGSLGGNTYYFKLGPASAYRENTQSNVPISNVMGSGVANSNINADLTTAFGANWADSGRIRWFIVGGNDQTTGGLVGGELKWSSYVSRERSDFNTRSNPPTLVLGALRKTLGNNIEACRSFHNGLISKLSTNPTNPTNPSNANGNFTPIIDNQGVITAFLPPVTTTQFGITQNVLQILQPGLIPNSTGLEGALDIWRLVHADSSAFLLSSGTDLDSGFGTGNAVLGTGQFCGTITLDSSGNLKVFGPPTTTANFASWAVTNNVTGGPNGDSDNDGIRNLAEYALNLNLAGSDGVAGTFTSGLLSFAKRAVAVTNGDVGYVIEESADLSAWTPATATSNTSSIITYALAPGSPKKFARLKLTTTP